MWRQNREPNRGSECVGTDLNRNYQYMWGGGNIILLNIQLYMVISLFQCDKFTPCHPNYAVYMPHYFFVVGLIFLPGITKMIVDNNHSNNGPHIEKPL